MATKTATQIVLKQKPQRPGSNVIQLSDGAMSVLSRLKQQTGLPMRTLASTIIVQAETFIKVDD